MTKRKNLRIGLLIDDYLIPNWAYIMLETIKNGGFSDFVVIVKKEVPQKKSSILKKIKTIWSIKNLILHIVFMKIERRIFKNSNDAFELKDIRKIVECEEITITPRETKFSDYVSKGDVGKIKNYNVDVFIRLGFRILRGDILNTSKYGIWSYHNGDNNVNRGGPAGVWEVFQGWTETGSILQILNEDLDGGIKLDATFVSTDKFSTYRNRNSLYMQSLLMLPKKLKELYNYGENEFFKETKTDKFPHLYQNRLYTTPSNLVVLNHYIRVFFKIIYRRIFYKFFFEQWILLFDINRSEKISSSFFRYKKIIPPKDRFYADPFPFRKGDKYYIFFEEFIYNKNKGIISVIEMDKKGNYTNPEIVLSKEYHLSYPFLIEDEGNLYMIPETAENKTIEIYKCLDFPLKWELCMNLMEDVKAVDTTILKKDDKYWMFTNLQNEFNKNNSLELFLYSSSTLLSDEWIPHPKNPIVSDVKNSRPAGNIFKLNNKLYRPSQNCAKRYGHGFNINEITGLNDEDYTEKNIQTIFPNWEESLLSTHTFNHINELTVIDANLKRRK